MLLTIGILFCDKDYFFLKELLQEIKKNVKVNYELILFNNCRKKIDLSIPNNILVLHRKGNIRQLAARKKIIEKAQGKYIWFIDADDKITNLNYMDISDADINNYSFITTGSKRNPVIYKDGITDVYNNTLMPILWNKIIKTEILKKVIQHIPNVKISCNEDKIYIKGCMCFGQTVKNHSKILYINRANYSSSNLEDYTNKIDSFKAALYGRKKSIKILKKFNSQDQSCAIFLGKMYKTKDLPTKIKMLKIMKKAGIKLDEVQEFWLAYVDISWTKENWYNTRKALSTVFPKIQLDKEVWQGETIVEKNSLLVINNRKVPYVPNFIDK